MYSHHLIDFKMERNDFQKMHQNDFTFKRDIHSLVFDISKTYQKKITKWPQFFASQKQIKISASKLHQFSIKNYTETTLIFCPIKLGRKN